MADEDDFKIKGVASAHAEVREEHVEPKDPSIDIPTQDSESPSQPRSAESAEAEAKSSARVEDEQEDEQAETREEQLKRYRWCKCFCEPAQFGRDHYYLQMDTQVSQWDEPDEPYWIWDASNQTIDESGLHYPAATAKKTSSEAADPQYTGYNPKIHGHYDPSADYARYHDDKREEEKPLQQAPPGMFVAGTGEYAATGSFNRFTGAFQDEDKSTDRHNDFNKSGRQMGAFFDVDAAANAHDGRSLKEERRNEKLSKKQIKELAEKRRAKKEKKRMDFYKS